MSHELAIEVARREKFGKNANRRLRRTGKIPAIVYGLELDAVPIELDRHDMLTLLREGTENSVFLLKLAGSDEQRPTMIRELQVDPLDQRILHIDFQRIDLKEKVRVSIPVELLGVASGVKDQGGVLDFVTREIEVECLPAQIPGTVELDVSSLEIGDHAEVGQIPLPAGVELVEEPDRVVASVIVPRAAIEEEEAAAAEAELLMEAEQEEPEVIGRGREEEEEQEESEGE